MRRSTFFSALPKVLLWSALSICACTKEDAREQRTNRGVEVGFCAGGVSTRTHITSNGLSSSWDAGDKVSLWAVNSEGRYYLANRQFYLHAAGDGLAFFTAVLDEPMTEGQYTYYLTSPSPVSTEGTKVSFNLPSVQDGKAGKGADIMIGTPTTGRQLDVLPEIVDHSTLRMELNHILHHFRFYIPEDDTAFDDEKIEKLVVSFPRPVVGTLTADCTDPASELTLSSASQTVTLTLDEPIGRSSASAKEYAIASVIPFAAQAGESLSIKAYCHNSVVEAEPVSLAERSFLAGHSTPVRIRQASVIPLYRLHFVLAGSNLGELPLKITLAAPSGCVFENGSNVYEYEQGDEIQIGQEMELVSEDEA
ncbi:MAG: fimbrillin family protein, partial [Bacteroidales bacterium]|nr:fimbrillin family protein [Bacteroidales bacterium]